MFHRQADFTPNKEGLIKKEVYDTFGKEAKKVFLVTLNVFNLIYKVYVNSSCFFFKLSNNLLLNNIALERHIYKHVLKSPLYVENKNRDILILKEIKGKSLYSLKITPSILKVFSSYIDQIHHKKLDDIRLWRKLDIFKNLDTHLNYLSEFKIISESHRKIIERVFRNNAEIITGISESRLLHGDLGFHNIFYNKGNITLIDWEDSIIGDPVYDISMFCSFQDNYKYLNFLKAPYKNEKNFELKFWLYYLRICIAKSVIRIRLGYDKLGNLNLNLKIAFALNNIPK